jgi:hypothetical protein
MGRAVLTLVLTVLFILVEWNGRNYKFAMENIGQQVKQPILRYVIYYGLIFILFYFSGDKQQFIYFQF